MKDKDFKELLILIEEISKKEVDNVVKAEMIEKAAFSWRWYLK